MVVGRVHPHDRKRKAEDTPSCEGAAAVLREGCGHGGGEEGPAGPQHAVNLVRGQADGGNADVSEKAEQRCRLG